MTHRNLRVTAEPVSKHNRMLQLLSKTFPLVPTLVGGMGCGFRSEYLIEHRRTEVVQPPEFAAFKKNPHVWRGTGVSQLALFCPIRSFSRTIETLVAVVRDWVPESLHPCRKVAPGGFLSLSQEPLQCSAILRGGAFASAEALIKEYEKHFAAGHSDLHRELFRIIDNIGGVNYCFTNSPPEIFEDISRHN